MPRPTRQPERLSDQLRAAVDSSGMSRLAIGRGIGLDRAAMSRFMNGKAGLSLETIDRLAAFLGLRLHSEKQPPRRET